MKLTLQEKEKLIQQYGHIPSRQEIFEKINQQQIKLVTALTMALETMPDDPILRSEILDAIRLAVNLKSQTKQLFDKK